MAADQHRYPLRPHTIAGFGKWYREAPVGVERVIGEMDGAGVDRAVLVQAFSAYGSDNRYVVDAARSCPQRCTSVVIVDVDDDAPEALRELADGHGASGVRLFAIGNAAQPQLDDPQLVPVLDIARALDLRIVVTILAPQIPELARMLGRYADAPVLLDHCAFPDLAGGPPFDRCRSLLELAAFPNLSLKVSSHLLAVAEAAGDPRDLVDHLAAAFGADRLVWGSDYPQTHDRPYADLVELGRHACSRLTSGGQRAFLGENALRLWPDLR